MICHKTEPHQTKPKDGTLMGTHTRGQGGSVIKEYLTHPKSLGPNLTIRCISWSNPGRSLVGWGLTSPLWCSRHILLPSAIMLTLFEAEIRFICYWLIVIITIFSVMGRGYGQLAKRQEYRFFLKYFIGVGCSLSKELVNVLRHFNPCRLFNYKSCTRTAIDRLSIIWKSDLSDELKRDFFQALVVSILWYRCRTRTLTKYLEKKLDGNCRRVLRVKMNKFW